MYYKSTYLPKVNFFLTTASFPCTKLNRIQRSFSQVLLQQLGYNKKTATLVTYELLDYGGIGINCLYIQQDIQNIQQFIRLCRSKNSISVLLNITMVWC